jgi:thioredoxin-related protein
MDDAAAVSAVSRFGVGATPSTIITDSEGNVLQQKAGGLGKTEFLELIAKITPSINLRD